MNVSFPPPPPRLDLVRHASALRRGVDVSRVLMRSRAVDLAGLEDQVGQLCAALLDLPAMEAEPLRRSLRSLLNSIELTIGECEAASACRQAAAKPHPAWALDQQHAGRPS